MLINSVILVLREVLEAAILVTALLALARVIQLGFNWLWPAAVASVAGVIGLASALGPLTDMLDGTGQEVTNAALQIGVFFVVCAVILDTRERSDGRHYSAFTGPLMALAVALAVTREGSEVLLYVRGFAAVESYRQAVLLGSALGAGIGVSAGTLCYWALVTRPGRLAYRLCLASLCLLGAGMVMQGVMLLEQAGWLLNVDPVWNSSWLVSEESVTGELLYAVLGYEATPGRVQLGLYLASLALAISASIYAARSPYRGGQTS
ncbi:hypothetical protein FV139_04165 [Parahaliea maris]|uniref:High-affinity iron transporter n=1 Tax=Parahaliea maris TaxID=2716870 RepID=A0A5C9A6T3_9GAMM|nr:FTR1 family protein [Parahaliea maris]TXS96673.1 hypothetical protein FV139_04165 [Parahaliea maris]